MRRFLIVAVAFVAAASATHRDIRLPPTGWTSLTEDVSSGPVVLREKSTWRVSTDVGSTVQLSCPYTKFPSSSSHYDGRCTGGKMTVIDGMTRTTYCGYPEDFEYQSKSSVLDIELDVDPHYSATLMCQCKSVQAPVHYEVVRQPVRYEVVKQPVRYEIVQPVVQYETVYIEPSTRIALTYPSATLSGDKSYRFISTSRRDIHLDCTSSTRTHHRAARRGGCVSDIVTITSDKKKPHKHCGKGKHHTKGKEITMSLESFHDGQVSCVVRG